MSQVEVIKSEGYYKIQETNTSPGIFIDLRQNKVEFEGISLMAEPVSFYIQVFDLIKTIIKKHQFTKLQVTFHFYYINTQSFKQIVSFFSYLESLNIKVEIIWYYSDEEIAELGSHLCDLLNLPLSLEYKPRKANDKFGL